jgi:hypothetical protein
MFGLTDLIFNISPFILFGNQLVGFTIKVGAMNPVGIAVIFKKGFAWKPLPERFFLLCFLSLFTIGVPPVLLAVFI